MGCAEPAKIEVRIGSRDAERIRVWGSVDAVHRAGTLLACLHDLSTTGARIQMREPRPAMGEILRLRLPLLPVEQVAEVVWLDSGYLGLRFFQPLDRPTLQILAVAMKPPGECGAEP